MIRNYVKKPIVIEALQYNGGNEDEVSSFTNGISEEFHSDKDGYYLLIPTLEGNMTASINDYIVKGQSKDRGVHFWPVKPDYFRENYDPC